MSDFIIDSSAWIEYFKGTANGLKFRKLIESGANNCFFSNIILAEVVSKSKREEQNIAEIIRAMQNNASKINESEAEFIEGGLIHAEAKLKKKEIGLADSIIIAASRKHSLKILTQDFHLKEFNSTYFKKRGKQE